MMNSFKLTLTALSAALILGTNTAVFAQENESNGKQEQTKAMEQNKVQAGKADQDAAKNQTMAQEKNTNQYGKQVKALHGSRFQDANGDGINDNAPDHDGDGIPNGKDADYQGSKKRAGNGKGGFVDANGDGINDNAEDWDNDGIPNGQDPDFERPQDGSGAQHQYGKMSRNQNSGNQSGSGKAGIGPGNGSGTGTGTCDGTGPKGSGKGSGKGNN
jgi:hypothetical protein